MGTQRSCSRNSYLRHAFDEVLLHTSKKKDFGGEILDKLTTNKISNYIPATIRLTQIWREHNALRSTVTIFL
jgi:hypothetical protein